MTYLPEKWTPDKIEKKIGIRSRAIAAENETSADLGVKAAEMLFTEHPVDRQEIDFLFFCTQSPDYFLPTSACIIQHRLGLKTSCGAIDYNLGCSGFVYGLAMAQGLIAAGIAKRILLITAETYSKFVYDKDWSVKTVFGDGAAAVFITSDDYVAPDNAQNMNACPGRFVLATDGAGAENLIVPYGGMRQPAGPNNEIESDNGSIRREGDLFMNGAKIFNFTLDVVPKALDSLYEKNSISINDIDLFVFHQANKHMLNAIRKKCDIPKEKYYIDMLDYGNTVSSTIPIALSDAWANNEIKKGDLIAIVGFGVGYSWGTTTLQF
jgi:3-oxoacyl-[acyl-carrier-protein] synthase-3